MLKRVRKTLTGVLGNRDFQQVRKLLDENYITVLDIGSAGGIELRWRKFSPILNYIGADPNSFDQQITPNKIFHEYEILPYGIAKENKIDTLFITRDNRKSSALMPNFDFIKRFPRFDRFDIVKKEEIEYITIDSYISKNIDFIKLDIQGCESEAIEGAKKTLHTVLGVELEVEFLKLYSNQPLFGSIDDLLSECNFEFIDFVNLCRWERDSTSVAGQLVSGDALYLKTPELIMNTDLQIAQIRKYLSILLIYHRFDLIEKCFSIQPNLKNSLKKFYKYQKKRRKMVRFVYSINRVINIFYGFFGQEIRSHVIY